MKKQTAETLVKLLVKGYLDIIHAFHFPIVASAISYKGLCDIIAITKTGVVLFIECKSEKGQLSQSQIRFKNNIQENGGHFILARGYEDIQKYLKEHEII